MSSEVYVVLTNGMVHIGARSSEQLLTDEQCNVDDAEVSAVYQQDDEGVAASIMAAKHCRRCFADEGPEQ